MRGKIIKYIEEKSYGFILDENGDKRFFHISNTIKPLEIQANQMIEFEPLENDKGLTAKNINILDSINKINNKFIKIYDTNIKCNNIKQFGISKEKEFLYKQKKEFFTSILFGEGNEKIFTWEELPEGTFQKGSESYMDDYTKIEKMHDYLYITTYQGDNYKWRGSLNELQKMIEYIEKNLS